MTNFFAISTVLSEPNCISSSSPSFSNTILFLSTCTGSISISNSFDLDGLDDFEERDKSDKSLLIDDNTDGEDSESESDGNNFAIFVILDDPPIKSSSLSSNSFANFEYLVSSSSSSSSSSESTSISTFDFTNSLKCISFFSLIEHK